MHSFIYRNIQSINRIMDSWDVHVVLRRLLLRRIQHVGARRRMQRRISVYQRSHGTQSQRRHQRPVSRRPLLLSRSDWWVNYSPYLQGRISRSGLIQDINMGSCVFQCDVPHQWIAQRQIGPMSVYCDGVGCHVLCLRHGIPVWQHIGKSTTATSRHHHDMTSDV